MENDSRGVWSDVPAQPGAVEQLVGSIGRPVHAYLFVGPAGVGKEEAARAFASALLCKDGGCGICSDCIAVARGRHPDLVSPDRSGAAITVDQARAVAGISVRMPVQSSRMVIILPDFHLVDEAAPALLKTLEEPPATTVFIVLADVVTPRLVTVASRCVEVTFGALGEKQIAEQLLKEGADADQASMAATIANGRLDRARSALADPAVFIRHELWHSMPSRLDSSGACIVKLVDELTQSLDDALEVVVAQQEAAMSEFAQQSKIGHTSTTKADLTQKHRREIRASRNEELRFGLSTLARAYRDRIVATDAFPVGMSGIGRSIMAVELIGEATLSLERNPNESLMLQALLVRLSGILGT
ncbi:MAG TPA: hypothetical protein VMU77_05625 [Acidimicrobiales bacterium]|nr:hypothetical protein [Acidimicrobiales bacterium]